ncbi:MAG: hypothetical protein CSA49_03705 [Gammaproteobacteria bacterium]|nr:MAG: hypothetical protein CSA49_03705 [Gammaproteobacteria bacterium]
MASYRKCNWPVLLKKLENSGLTQTQFCKDKSVNPRYFRTVSLMGSWKPQMIMRDYEITQLDLELIITAGSGFYIG